MILLSFLSARLRILRSIPPLPHLLDTFLWIHTFLFRKKTFRVMEDLFEDVLTWDGVTWHLHRFGGREWRVLGREIGHLHGNGVLDIFLPDKRIAEEAIGSEEALEHHTHPKTAWVSIALETPPDADAAKRLLHRARAGINPPCELPN